MEAFEVRPRPQPYLTYSVRESVRGLSGGLVASREEGDIVPIY